MVKKEKKIPIKRVTVEPEEHKRYDVYEDARKQGIEVEETHRVMNKLYITISGPTRTSLEDNQTVRNLVEDIRLANGYNGVSPFEGEMAFKNDKHYMTKVLVKVM